MTQKLGNELMTWILLAVTVNFAAKNVLLDQSKDSAKLQDLYFVMCLKPRDKSVEQRAKKSTIMISSGLSSVAVNTDIGTWKL